MDPSTLLSQLKDIHAPEAIPAWPFAIGWWLLILISLIAILSLFFFFFKKHSRNAWKRQAVRAFKELSAVYTQHPTAENLLQINRLLKQALSSANNNRDYLHLCESEWARALTAIHYKNSTILHDQEVNILSTDIYARQTAKLDSASLERISLWIKHLG